MEMPARRAVLLDRGHTADEMEMPARWKCLREGPCFSTSTYRFRFEMAAAWKCLREGPCFSTLQTRRALRGW